MKKILLTASLFLVTGISAQTYFSDDFENGLGNWTNVDQDGDGQKWSIFAYGEGQGDVATSASWASQVALTPDNWLISNAIDLTSAASGVALEWKAWGQDPAYPGEEYSVYIGTENTVSALTTSGVAFNEVISSGSPTVRNLDLTNFIGETIYVAFRHHNSSDEFRINLDDVKVFAPVANDLMVNTISVDNSMLGNRTFTIKFQSNGTDPITAFDFTYTYDGATETESVTGVNLTYAQEHTFTFQKNISAQGSKAVAVTITTADDDASNNNKTESFNFFPNVIQYAATDSQGNPFDLYERLSNGQAIILDFMASWCVPCQTSTPALSKLVQDNGSGQGPIEALAISVEQNDNNNVLNGLNWNGGYYAYPKFAYATTNYNNYYHYAVNHGFNTGGSIPFFVMICPNLEDPSSSTIVKQDVGYGNGMFNAYQTALNNCPTATYLDIIKVAEETVEFNVYPNPATNLVNVEFELQTEEDITISIINTVGQVVSTNNLGKVNGVQSTQVDVSNLNAGIYIIKLATKNGETTKRLSVQ